MVKRGVVISTHLSTKNGELHMIYNFSNGELKICPLPIIAVRDKVIPRPYTTRDGDFY